MSNLGSYWNKLKPIERKQLVDKITSRRPELTAATIPFVDINFVLELLHISHERHNQFVIKSRAGETRIAHKIQAERCAALHDKLERLVGLSKLPKQRLG